MKKLRKSILKFTWCMAIVSICWLTVSAAAMAADQADVQFQDEVDQKGPLLEKEALDALNTMSNYLRTLSVFEVKSNFYRDEVLDSGQKILESGTSTLTVRVPDKLFSQVNIDEKGRSFSMYFDGKKLSLYEKTGKYYVSIPAPGTLQDLVLTTFAEKGIELPLQDLFLWGTEASENDEMTAAMIIGKSTINSADCTHYAYRQEGVDWQIWIKDGEQPLPLQLVITSTSDDAKPQYAARIIWNLTPSVPDALFTFTPPRDANAIGFLPFPEASNE